MPLVQSPLCLVRIANDGLYSNPVLFLNKSQRLELGSDVYDLGMYVEVFVIVVR
jgi:hypothetical protein